MERKQKKRKFYLTISWLRSNKHSLERRKTQPKEGTRSAWGESAVKEPDAQHEHY